MCFKNGFQTRQWVAHARVWGQRPKKHGDLCPPSLSWGQREASDLLREGMAGAAPTDAECGTRLRRHLKTNRQKNSNSCDNEPEATCFHLPLSDRNLTGPRCGKARSHRVSNVLFLLYTLALFTLDVRLFILGSTRLTQTDKNRCIKS